MIKKVANSINPTCEQLIDCKYVGGQILKLPKWYLHLKGHELEANLKAIFPELNRFQREPDLKIEVIKKVIDDIPDLVAIDFLELFKEIQKN